MRTQAGAYAAHAPRSAPAAARARPLSSNGSRESTRLERECRWRSREWLRLRRRSRERSRRPSGDGMRAARALRCTACNARQRCAGDAERRVL
jgi:hypothetical protein